MEDEKLIELVQAYRFLYDKKSSNFKNVDKKQQAWEKISKDLSLPVDVCQKRWMSLRDRFAREWKKYLPSGSGSDVTKERWHLFDSMRFLEDHIKPRNLTFDLKTRMTFWNCAMSSFCIWISYIGYNQSCVQRIVSLPSLAHAKRSLIIFGFGFLLIMFFNCFTGIVMYALYHDCDPLKTGFVEKPDKLVPYFVQDIVGHLKGMPGLFISCVFSAALSTMSASMNALAGIIYMDYIKPRIRHTESRANLIMKVIVFFFGIYCILGGVIVEKFTSMLQLIYTIAGITMGAVFGVFILGMLVPKAHGKGAVWGVIASMIVMFIIVIGGQNRIHYIGLTTTTEGCTVENSTIFQSTNVSVIKQLTTPELEDNFNIFEMSFNWYTVFGALVVFIVGVPLSYLLPPGKYEKFDINLLSPVVQSFVQYQPARTEELIEVNDKK